MEIPYTGALLGDQKANTPEVLLKARMREREAVQCSEDKKATSAVVVMVLLEFQHWKMLGLAKELRPCAAGEEGLEIVEEAG